MNKIKLVFLVFLISVILTLIIGNLHARSEAVKVQMRDKQECQEEREKESSELGGGIRMPCGMSEGWSIYGGIPFPFVCLLGWNACFGFGWIAFFLDVIILFIPLCCLIMIANYFRKNKFII